MTVRVLPALLFLSLVPARLANYDICDDVTDQGRVFRACHPAIGDVVRGSSARISLDPPGATCGTPANTFRVVGDRVSPLYIQIDRR